jgi:hypothetical protein
MRHARDTHEEIRLTTRQCEGHCGLAHIGRSCPRSLSAALTFTTKRTARGRQLGNIRDLRLQLDAEPVEVVDDVAAGRSGGDDPLDSVDMEWVARGEIFWLLSRGQFVEEQRRISARVLR